MTSNESVASNLNILRQGSTVQFGNLLTLPIGDAGLLYVEPVYVQSQDNNGFPLLQKVIVNYQGRIGYGDTLAQGLDQVFGAGAGDAAPDGGDTGSGSTPSTSPPSTSAPSTTTPPAGGGDVVVDSATAQAIAAIQQALADLAAAQQSGDFAAVGQAQQALADASAAFEAAQSSASASASSAPASPTG